MKNVSISKAIALCLCLLSTFCAARTSVVGNLNADREEIRKIELDLRDALSTGKVDALDYFLADDYVHTNYRGVVRTKREIISDLDTRTVTREYVGLDDIQIQVIGDAAILTARASTRRNERGTLSAGDYRQMRVFRREQGRWRAILMQTTLIAE